MCSTDRNTKIYPANLKGDVAFSVLVRGSCHQPSCKSSFKKTGHIRRGKGSFHQSCFSIADLQTHQRQVPVL